jgi:ferrochelatase
VCRLAGYEGPWELVWQSRSGPPQVPWLEPDVGDHAAELAARGVRELVVVPIGFTSDHVEVVWDLDTELAQRCGELGLSMTRVSTPGTDPRFVELLASLVRERWDGPTGSDCPGGFSCCRPATANPA